MKNKQILLARRPRGPVQEEDFRMVETDVLPIRDGQVLTRVHYLSLDPYMRGRMDEAKSYAPPQPLGEVMIGGTVGEVIESKNPEVQARRHRRRAWPAGRSTQVTDGAGLRKLDVARIPLSAYLGCVGMPGVTAWYGLTQIGKPKAGETVVVSAAAAPSAAWSASWRSCAAAARSGSPAGRRSATWSQASSASTPASTTRRRRFADDLEGRDARTGSTSTSRTWAATVFDAALARMNAFGRVARLRADRRLQRPAAWPSRTSARSWSNRLTLQGFIVSEHLELWPQALAELAQHVAARTDPVSRDHRARAGRARPRAFIGLLKGENVGKQLVKLVSAAQRPSCVKTTSSQRSVRLVVAQDVDAVGGAHLEVAVIGPVPAIDHVDHFADASAQLEPPRRLFAAVAGMAVHPNVHETGNG